MDLENSPEVTEETLPGVAIAISSGVSGVSLEATADRVGLVLIDIFRVNETSVDEDTLRGELIGGLSDPSFGLASP